MQEFSLDYVARKSVKGVFALISRTFLIQLLAIAANFVLTIFLDPSTFGVFFVVSSIVVFLNYFQDIGLAASLIQKKEEPTTEELRTVFTVQQLLVLILVVPAFLLSSKIGDFYHLSSNGVMLFNALLFSFFLSSLRTIPTIIIERSLDFNKLVVVQILENLVYNVSLIIFAVKGFGIDSFTISVLARSIVGLVVIYIVSPWNIGIAFNKSVFKKLLSFGVPFQANSLLALIKDDLLNIYIGKALPLTQVGYIGFAQKWAFLPLRLVMDNVVKVTFPSYSRLQHDKAALKLAIEKSLFLISIIIFPCVVGLALLSQDFFNYVPKYEKWEPAFLSLVFFSLNTVFSSISTPLTNFLNAIGKVKITLYLMIFWTAATWLCTIIFIKNFGFNGVAGASFAVSVTSVGVIFIARRYVQFSITSPILKQILAAILMGLFIVLTKGFVTSLFMLLLEVVLAGIVYFGFVFVFSKQELLKTSKFIIGTIKAKS